MKMTHDHHLNIFDVVTSLLNLFIQILVLVVIYGSKNIIERRTPDLGKVWPS